MCAALGCLPESSDLSEYSSGWSEVVLAGGFAGLGGSAGSSASGLGGSLAGAAGSDAQAGGAAGLEGSGGTGASPVAGAGASSEGGSDGDLPLAGSGGAPPLPPPAEPPAPCSDGVFVAEQGACYLVALEPATWQAARLACIDWDGELVKVESLEEDALLGSMTEESIWLGASDTAVDNVYVWTDGSPIDFGNWAPGQPDAFAGSIDCVEKRVEAANLWFDQPCDNARFYICEKPPSD